MGTARIRTEFPPAGKGHQGDHSDNAENHLKYHDQHILSESAAVTAVITITHHRESHHTSQEHDKSVNDALKQGHGHHIAIDDVSHFMAQNRFHLLLTHGVKQAGGNSN